MKVKNLGGPCLACLSKRNALGSPIHLTPVGIADVSASFDGETYLSNLAPGVDLVSVICLAGSQQGMTPN